jgi:hypothetical protein
MQTYEYKVVPAPVRGEKERGARTVPERFGVALGNLMNAMARDGWEYLRADTLPCEERVGLTGRTTQFQNMLVFRRSLAPLDTALPAVSAAAVPNPLPAEEIRPMVPRLGAAEQPAGVAPAVGSVRPELAAE